MLALPDDVLGEPAGRAFVVAIGEEGREEALEVLSELRRAGLPAQMEFDARGVRGQMKRADRLRARVALIVGGDELARGEVTLRDMRSGEQRPVARAGIVEAVNNPGRPDVRPTRPGGRPVSCMLFRAVVATAGNRERN